MKQGTRRKNLILSRFLYVLSLVFLSFGLFSLGWIAWPAPTDAVQLEIPAGTLPAAPAGADYVSLSDYALSISWPRWVRRGQTGEIHLRLTDLLQEPLSEGEARASQVVLIEPALYLLPVDPPGGVQANLGDDQDLQLTWQVRGDESGAYPGKLYVSFGFFDETLNDLVEVPVAVIDLNIRVIELWGLDSGLVIWLGLAGLLLWGALFVLGRVAAVR